MTKLLISVRDAEEAQIAAREGADLVDIKEPLRGPLGAADAETIQAIAQTLGERVPLSAALGELLAAAELSDALAGSLSYVKFGLAGCGARSDWPELWARQLARLSVNTGLVAVVYADWQAACAPAPEEVLEQAARLDVRAVLVDTWDKSGGSLARHWSRERIARFIEQAHQRRMIAVLAGSLGMHDIEALGALEPDYVGVRGAVCDGARTGRLSAARVREIRALVQSVPRSVPPLAC